MTGFVPRNPDYARAVREAFARQPFMGLLAAELTVIAPGRVEIRIPWRDAVAQNHGFFHGGVLGALADVAGGFAGFSLMPPGTSVLTAEYKITMLAPGLGQALIGRGAVLRAGGTLVFTEARLWALNDGVETLCAVALQTLRAKTGGVTF